MRTFNIDENNLLKSYLNEVLPGCFYEENPQKWKQSPLGKLEFILDTHCNQSCDYCYIHQHGKQLYPTCVSKSEYLKNVQILLNFLKQKKIYVKVFDIFSGDILKDNLIYDVFDELLAYKEYVKNNSEEFANAWMGVTFPVNTFYLAQEYHQNQIKKYYNLFAENNMGLNVSISTDGLYSVDIREKRDECSQEFFDKIFMFAKEINAGFHPMISPENVSYGVKNVRWWVENYKKIGREHKVYPMYLHVRNNNWTAQNLLDYENFLEECWNQKFLSLNGNILSMANYICGKKDFMEHGEGFDPIIIPQAYSERGELLGCSIQKGLFIDMSDFSINCCHRLSYPQFKGGKFLIKNEQIVDAEAINMTMYQSIQNFNPLLNIKCNNCIYRHLCLKGCLGAQFENSGEVFFPIDTICTFEKRRLNKLIQLAKRDNILDLILQGDIIKDKVFLESMHLIIKSLENEGV